MGNERSTCFARFVRGRGRPLLSRPLWLLPCEGLRRFVRSAEFCADGFVPARLGCPAFVCWESASVRRESCDGTRRNQARRSLSRRIFPLRQRPSAAAGINSRFLRSRSPIDPKREFYSFWAIRFRAQPLSVVGAGQRESRKRALRATLGISTRRDGREKATSLSGVPRRSTQAGGRRASQRRTGPPPQSSILPVERGKIS